jgi:MraZ protein
VDDKGRLKLPVSFQTYLATLPDKRLFATTLDGHIARVYPMEVWRDNEKIMDTPAEDTEDAEDTLMTGYDLGGDAEMDPQGRILIPPELRRAVNIENQPVKIVFFRGAIDIYNEEAYRARMRKAAENREKKLAGLRKRGVR